MRSKYMKRSVLVIAIVGVLLLALCVRSGWVAAWADNGLAGVQAPRILIPCVQRDLGNVSQGKVLRTEFRVENTGTRRLVLMEETPGCCDQTENQLSITVPPGGSRDIAVEIDTARWHGHIEHIVRYRTNDPQLPLFSLAVTAVAQ